jgi:hypothetical protein
MQRHDCGVNDSSSAAQRSAVRLEGNLTYGPARGKLEHVPYMASLVSPKSGERWDQVSPSLATKRGDALQILRCPRCQVPLDLPR